MSKPLEEIKIDLRFIRSHTLQPKWYKVLKVFILLGFLLGYYALFSWPKTLLFFASFICLSLGVHMLYRIKTDTWKRSWLDFVVVEENNEIKAKSIGKYYYSAVVFNVLLSIAISQVLG